MPTYLLLDATAFLSDEIVVKMFTRSLFGLILEASESQVHSRGISCQRAYPALSQAIGDHFGQSICCPRAVSSDLTISW